MLLDQTIYFVDLASIKTIVRSQLHRVKPELGFVARRFDVNMRRFAAFVAEKMEAVSTDPQDRWHALSPQLLTTSRRFEDIAARASWEQDALGDCKRGPATRRSRALQAAALAKRLPPAFHAGVPTVED